MSVKRKQYHESGLMIGDLQVLAVERNISNPREALFMRYNLIGINYEPLSQIFYTLTDEELPEVSGRVYGTHRFVSQAIGQATSNVIT